MTRSSNGYGRIVSSGSTSVQQCKSNGKNLALETSKLKNPVMGMDRTIKNENVVGENVKKADAILAAQNLESMTAAALLWGRGPMTTAPLISSYSKGCEGQTKSNSPASNAAAALLVGMSMRKERETSISPASKPHSPLSTSYSTEDSRSKENEAFDVEAKWRQVRMDIAQSQVADSFPEGPEEPEGLELPKGVTRRPSGAWQAQIYFAGKTRYIGVWDRPQQAATAYNMAKEALKDLKAQQKSFRKRQRNHPGKIDKKVGAQIQTMATPNNKSELQHLPSSITWPSSASSSSTASSGFFRSPTYSRGPFKKRKGDDLSPSPDNSRLTSPLPNPQRSGHTVRPLPPPSGYSYSAFSQHYPTQQHIGGSPLTHPALQLLSLRPTQQPSHLSAPNSVWIHGHRPENQPQQPYCQQGTANAQHMPYSRATLANHKSDSSRTNLLDNKLPAIRKGGKMGTKNKRSKQSLMTKKPNRTAGSEEKDKFEKNAQNEKWKTIRAEVIAFFDEYKRLNGKKTSGDEDPRKNKTFDKDVLRGITVRPSGKFQAQLYFGGRSRYIGVFDSEFEAASAYEMIRSRLKNDTKKSVTASTSMDSLVSSSTLSLSSTCSVVQGSDGGKDAKAATKASSETSAMRSITPSPTPRTPRANVHPRTTKNILLPK